MVDSDFGAAKRMGGAVRIDAGAGVGRAGFAAGGGSNRTGLPVIESPPVSISTHAQRIPTLITTTHKPQFFHRISTAPDSFQFGPIQQHTKKMRPPRYATAIRFQFHKGMDRRREDTLFNCNGEPYKPARSTNASHQRNSIFKSISKKNSL